MKKLKKVLMLVTFFSILISVNSVSAQEIDENALNVITSPISIEATEKDYFSNGNIGIEVANKVKTILESNGYDLDASSDVSAYNYSESMNIVDGLYSAKIELRKSGEIIAEKVITINYSNTGTVADSTKQEIQTKLDSADKYIFAYYPNVYIDEDSDYPVLIKENDFDVSELTDSIKNQLDDSSLEVMLYGWNVYVFKNEVFCAKGEIEEKTIQINKTDIGDSSDTYKEMAKELSNKGFDNIISAVELTLTNTYDGVIEINLVVGTDYTGKNVVVLHKKHDGTYEQFNKTVDSDGVIKVEVSELSPFMIALDNTTTTTSNASTTAKSNNAQTSSINIVLLSVVAISSLVGIILILVSKKRRIA